MSRAGISGAMVTALTASTVRPIYLVRLQTSGADIYLNDGAKDVTFSGQQYLGSGLISIVPTLQETSELRATNCDIIISGASSAMISVALTLTQAKTAQVYLGLFDSSYSLIVDPFLIFKGLFDTATIDETAPEPLLTLSYESMLLKLNRPGTFRYTDQVQQALYPGDLGFQYAALLEDWQGFWGKTRRIKYLKKNKERT